MIITQTQEKIIFCYLWIICKHCNMGLIGKYKIHLYRFSNFINFLRILIVIFVKALLMSIIV